MKLDALHGEIEALRARMRAERLAGIDHAALVWLTLVPVWSASLARECGLAGTPADLDALLDRCTDAGLIARDQDRFWMLEGPRQDVLPMLRARGLDSDEIARMGRAILAHATPDTPGRAPGARRAPGGIDLPSPTRRWAELAARLDRDPGAWLRDKVAALIARGGTAEARDWLDAAERLARLVPGTLETAARLAGYRLERAHRRALDEHELAHFLPREEQIAAFRALLDGSDDAWSLHYLGMGGVGKTTLIRHIAAHLAPAWGAPVSRIDFDYLSPDYPVRRPGQLLLALAVQLGAYAESRLQEKYLGILHDQVLALHEGIAAEVQPEDPLDNVRRGDFERVLITFGELLGTMPAPALLILDTCEEIAKLSPVGGRLPAVEATFEILERLHARVPAVRVVIAGRRLLARAGHGWRASVRALSQLETRLPARKDHLRLHVIRGFTGDEARRFLIEERGLDASAPIDAILARSPEPGWPDVVGGMDGGERRYGPFDLRLYADLVADEPGLRAEDLSVRDSDPYVELRIVRRMGTLAAWLPAVALLGRFDRAMLAAAAGAGADAGVDRAFAELAAQEWIAAYSDEAGGGGFLEVKPPLQSRLRGYYGHPERRDALAPVHRTLAAGLAELVRAWPLGKLGVSHLDAALRLGEVGDVVELWRAVELRIPAEASWGWAFNVTRALLGEGAPAAERGSVLHAVVRSTHAAACLRQQPARRVEDEWLVVAERAFGGTPVLDRARLGLAACSDRRSFVLAALRPAALWQRLAGWLDPSQAAASVGAAVEGMIERAEAARDASKLVWRADALADWLDVVQGAGIEPGLLAFVHCLLGRAADLDGDRERCRRHLQAAVDGVAGLPTERHRDAWLDWREPASLRDRVRLEALRVPAWHGHGFDEDAQARWLAQARIDTIDGERLAARLFLMRHAHREPDPDMLRDLRPRLAYVLRRRATCRAHEDTPPLFAVIARALIQAGAVDDGEALAREHLDAATAAADDPHTVKEAMVLLAASRAGRTRSAAAKQAAPARAPLAVARPAPADHEVAKSMPWPAMAPAPARHDESLDPALLPQGYRQDSRAMGARVAEEADGGAAEGEVHDEAAGAGRWDGAAGEAVRGEAAGAGRWDDDDMVVVGALGPPAGRPAVEVWQRGAVCVVAPDAWHAGLSAPWQAMAEVTAHAHHGVHRIVHVVGRPVATLSGVRLRVGDIPMPSKRADAPGRGTTISPRDLPFAGSWLAVVQAEPVDRLRRGPLEREESAHLRAFAADVFDQGAYAVLMLPALPLDIAQAALRALAGALHADAPPRPAELATARQAVRRAIFEALAAGVLAGGGEAAGDISRELAFDVTLFVREDG